MQFVLFRHAHKGMTPFDDPELSPQGFAQAAGIPALIRQKTIPQPSQLYVSPKRRTAQTFYPVAKEFGLELQAAADLDQGHSSESLQEFRRRISTWLDQISNQDEDAVVYACTHYDWIEESMSLINSDRDLNSFEFSHWAPAQFCHFNFSGGIWKFTGKGAVR